MKFLSKVNLPKLIIGIIENRLFKPIAISLITSFVLFNSFSYFRILLEDYNDLKVVKNGKANIRVRIPESILKFYLEEDQVSEYKIKSGDTI